MVRCPYKNQKKKIDVVSCWKESTWAVTGGTAEEGVEADSGINSGAIELDEDIVDK